MPLSSSSDNQWHYDAPQFYDFSKTDEENNHLGDTWFAHQGSSISSVSVSNVVMENRKQVENTAKFPEGDDTGSYNILHNDNTVEYHPVNYSKDVYLNSPSQRRSEFKRRDMKHELARANQHQGEHLQQQQQQKEHQHQQQQHQGVVEQHKDSTIEDMNDLFSPTLPARTPSLPSHGTDMNETTTLKYTPITLPQRRLVATKDTKSMNSSPSDIDDDARMPFSSSVHENTAEHGSSEEQSRQKSTMISPSLTTVSLHRRLPSTSTFIEGRPERIKVFAQNSDKQSVSMQQAQRQGPPALGQAEETMLDAEATILLPDGRKRPRSDPDDDGDRETKKERPTIPGTLTDREHQSSVSVSLLRLITEVQSHRRTAPPTKLSFQHLHNSSTSSTPPSSGNNVHLEQKEEKSPLLQLISQINSQQDLNAKHSHHSATGLSPSWKIETTMERARRVIREASSKCRKWIIPHQTLPQQQQRQRQQRVSTVNRKWGNFV